MTIAAPADRVTVTRLPCAGDRLWQRAADGLKGSHLAHASEWAQVITRAYGHDPLYLAGVDDAGRVGLLPAVVVRRPFFGPVVSSMPFLDGGGPCSPSSACTAALIDALIVEARRVGAARVELRSAQRLEVSTEPATHKVNLTLPLPAEPDCLWRQLDRGVRNQVRKAERSGLSVQIGGADLLDEFHFIHAARMSDLGSPAHGRAFFRETLEAFSGRARVVVVRHGTTAIGGLIAIPFNETMFVPWASCLKEYFALCPNMLLYWETIRTACLEGFRQFDFGRSTSGSGTYRFKRQWGAIESPLFLYTIPVGQRPGLSLPGSDRAAASVVALWQHLPLSVTRRIGPRVRRYLTQ